MNKISMTINGAKVSVPKDYSVMRAAEEMGVIVPRLCFLKGINETSSCRLCVVDVKGMRGLKNSCTLAVQDGMEIETDTDEINAAVVSPVILSLFCMIAPAPKNPIPVTIVESILVGSERL